MEKYGFRLLSEKDHQDLYGLARQGCKWEKFYEYANRPEDEVQRYIHKNLPTLFKRIEENEQATEPKVD